MDKKCAWGLSFVVLELLVQSFHHLLEVWLGYWASSSKGVVVAAVFTSRGVDVVTAIAVGGRGWAGGGTGVPVISGVDLVTAVGRKAGGGAGGGVDVNVSDDGGSAGDIAGGAVGSGVDVAADAAGGSAGGGPTSPQTEGGQVVVVVSTSTTSQSDVQLVVVVWTPTSPQSEGQLAVMVVVGQLVVVLVVASTPTSPQSEVELLVVLAVVTTPKSPRSAV